MSWTAAQFNRRHYTVESDDLDKAKKIEIKIFIDGKVFVHLVAREPGIVAFISKPTEPGFELDVVEGTGQRLVDPFTPHGGVTEPLADWQLKLLGLG